MLDYPNQDLLVRAANVSMPKEKYDRLLAHSRSVGREKGIDATLAKYNIDVIIAPADSAFNLLVSAAGNVHPFSSLPCSLSWLALINIIRLPLSNNATLVPRL